MFSGAKGRLPAWSVPILLAGFLFFYRLSDAELSRSHEARAAQNAQSILNQGDWALPRLFNGRVELQKPPLYYWLVALAGWLGGGEVTTGSVRLPAALAGLGCVAFLYILGRARGRPRAGFLAALLLATFLHFTWMARVGRIDMPLTLSVTLAVGSFYLARCRRREQQDARVWPWLLSGYLGIVAGLLLKGPIAAVLTGIVMGCWRLLDRGTVAANDRKSRSSLWWGIPLVTALAAPWFLWANWRTDNELWRVFFWYHNFQRGVGEGLASHPWWFYGPRLFLDLLPWSIFFPLAAWFFMRHSRWREDAEARLGLVWLAGITVFLSLMRFKRADYLLPAYPGAALWLGCLADRWLSERQEAGTRAKAAPGWLRMTMAGALGIYALGWWGYLDYIEPVQEQGRPYRRLAREIRRRTSGPVIFFRTEAHELVFQVGRPLDTILEWENLDVWASRPGPIYVVMPPDCARDWEKNLVLGRLEEVLRTTDLVDKSRDRPLVVLRSIPPCLSGNSIQARGGKPSG